MGAAWYAEDNFEEPINFLYTQTPLNATFVQSQVMPHGSAFATGNALISATEARNTSAAQAALNLNSQVQSLAPATNIQSSVILGSYANNFQQTQMMGSLLQPTLNTIGGYTPIQLPAALPFYASTVGGMGQDAPPASIAVPVNMPQLSYQVQQRMTLLGLFQLQGMQTGILLSQAYFFSNLGIIYIGEWLRGKPHGRGMMIFQNGGIFDGYFLRGKTVGIGRFILPNGDFYEGEFMGLAAHGRGVCLVGNLIYEGDFVQNMPHGNGMESTIDGSVKFIGQYRHGQKVQGKMCWNGFVYNGPFVNGLFNGVGFVKTPQGIYQGNFVDGRMVSGTPVNAGQPMLGVSTVGGVLPGGYSTSSLVPIVSGGTAYSFGGQTLPSNLYGSTILMPNRIGVY